MPALRVHDPRRGEAASPFDGQVSPLALHSSALHRLHSHTHAHTNPRTLSPVNKSSSCSLAGLNAAVFTLLFFFAFSRALSPYICIYIYLSFTAYSS